MLALLLLTGLIAVAGGGFGLYTAITLRPTAAQASAAGQQEIATRWLRLTAGQIFPRTVTYTSAATGADWSARLVGIAPRASCAAVTDPVVGAALTRAGCRAILRATYTDTSGTLVATVGVAAMPNATVAAAALPIYTATPTAGVDALGFSGTLSSLFGNAQRAVFGDQIQGPYIVLFPSVSPTAGSRMRARPIRVLDDLGTGVSDELEVILNSAGKPCQEKDIRC